MKFLSLLAGVMILTGCKGPPEALSAGAIQGNGTSAAPIVETVAKPVKSTSKRSVELKASPDLGPNPKLARAINADEAKPSGPITNERYQRWVKAAELRVRLEGHIGQLANLQDFLDLAETSEDEFIHRLALQSLQFHRSTDQQLKVFKAVEQRLRQEIGRTQATVKNLRIELAETEKSPTTIIDRGGDKPMPDKPLNECGLPASEVTKLKQLGIHTSRDFVEHFYLPEQHEALAAFLGRTVEDVIQLVDSVGNQIPADELNELVEEVRKPRTFGVLSPDVFGGPSDE